MSENESMPQDTPPQDDPAQNPDAAQEEDSTQAEVSGLDTWDQGVQGHAPEAGEYDEVNSNAEERVPGVTYASDVPDREPAEG